MSTIFVELDVLTNAAHRSEFKRDFAVYDSLAGDDEPVQWALELLELLNQSHVIVVFTVRNELHRMATESWLMDNNVSCDHLLMRPEGDYTPAIDLKRILVLDHFKGRDDKMEEETFAIWSNHEATIEAFREDGFNVIQTGWGE